VELRDVERDRIHLEVRVVLTNQHDKRTAEIGRSAWPAVVNTLARFEIVEIRVAPNPGGPAATAAVTVLPSSSTTVPSTVEGPPPYASEMDCKEVPGLKKKSLGRFYWNLKWPFWKE
jgi:hypothetical protein